MITYKWIISSMDCVIQETVEGQELEKCSKYDTLEKISNRRNRR